MDLEERTDVHTRAFVIGSASGIFGSYFLGNLSTLPRENLAIGVSGLLLGYLTKRTEGGNAFTAVAAGAGYVAAMKHMLH